MKKENIIHFSDYEDKPQASPPPVSEDLKDAIQNLIDRLRNQGPLPSPNDGYPTAK